MSELGKVLFAWLGQGGGSRLQVVMFGLSDILRNCTFNNEFSYPRLVNLKNIEMRGFPMFYDTSFIYQLILLAPGRSPACSNILAK